MDSTRRKWLYHSTPGWIDDRSEIFFLTLCQRDRGTNELTEAQVANAILESLTFYHKSNKLFVHQALIMPDHLHMLVRVGPAASSLKNCISAFKSWTHKQLGVHWQQGFFEHRIRSSRELNLKFEYIANNPVRAGLVDHSNEWPWRMEAFLG